MAGGDAVERRLYRRHQSLIVFIFPGGRITDLDLVWWCLDGPQVCVTGCDEVTSRAHLFDSLWQHVKASRCGERAMPRGAVRFGWVRLDQVMPQGRCGALLQWPASRQEDQGGKNVGQPLEQWSNSADCRC